MEDTNLKVRISTAFDPSGTDAARTDMDKTVEAAERVSKASKDAASVQGGDDMNKDMAAMRLFLRDIDDGWKRISSSVKSFALEIGKITGAVALVTLAVQSVRAVYNLFTAEARKAHEEQEAALKKAVEEAKNMGKELAAMIDQAREMASLQAGKDGINDILQTYQTITAEIQRQVEMERTRAAIQARIKGMEADAKKYELDNKLDRGEIGIEEHRQQSRALEDQAVQDRYTAELDEVNGELRRMQETARLAGEALKNLETKADMLKKGEGIVVTDLEKDAMTTKKTQNDAAILGLEKKMRSLEGRGLSNTLSYQQAASVVDLYKAENDMLAKKLKDSADWLKTPEHGGNYQGYTAMTAETTKEIAEKLKTVNETVQQIQSKKGDIAAIGEAKTAEQGMIAGKRKQEDATLYTKDTQAMPVKEAVEELTRQKTELADAAKVYAEAAKTDAAALAEASGGLADAAKEAKNMGDVGTGREAQDLVADIQKMVKSSSDLAGKGKDVAALSKTLQDLLKKNVFGAQESTDMQEVVRVLTNMAEGQTAAKANADQTAALEKQIADLGNMDTMRRNLAQDEAAYQRIGEALAAKGEQQQQAADQNSAASAALQTTLTALADRTVTPAELPGLVAAADSLAGAQDAASVQVRGYILQVIAGLGTAANRLNTQRTDLGAVQHQLNSINAALNAPRK